MYYDAQKSSQTGQAVQLVIRSAHDKPESENPVWACEKVEDDFGLGDC